MHRGAADFAAHHAWKIMFSTVAFPTLSVFVANTDFGRMQRFRYKFRRQIPEFQLADVPYIAHARLEADLRFAMVDGMCYEGGVRVLWSPHGAGKTTAIKRMIYKLIEEGHIAGCIYITPSAAPEETLYDCFVRATSDVFGPIIRPGAQVSSVVGHGLEKPYVFVFDQIEGTHTNDRSLETLVRALAYDSDSCMSYITLLATSDVHLAEEVYNLNGHTKITLLARHRPLLYRWGRREIDLWIKEALRREPDRLRKLLRTGSPLRKSLVGQAVAAGTPECLVYALQTLKTNSTLSPSVDTYVKNCVDQWRLGEETLGATQHGAEKAGKQTKGWRHWWHWWH